MTPAEILPELSPVQLRVLADWLDRLPVKCVPTNDISVQTFHLASFLYKLADLRRKG